MRRARFTYDLLKMITWRRRRRWRRLQRARARRLRRQARWHRLKVALAGLGGVAIAVAIASVIFAARRPSEP